MDIQATIGFLRVLARTSHRVLLRGRRGAVHRRPRQMAGVKCVPGREGHFSGSLPHPRRGPVGVSWFSPHRFWMS